MSKDGSTILAAACFPAAERCPAQRRIVRYYQRGWEACLRGISSRFLPWLDRHGPGEADVTFLCQETCQSELLLSVRRELRIRSPVFRACLLGGEVWNPQTGLLLTESELWGKDSGRRIRQEAKHVAQAMGGVRAGLLPNWEHALDRVKTAVRIWLTEANAVLCVPAGRIAAPEDGPMELYLPLPSALGSEENTADA